MATLIEKLVEKASGAYRTLVLPEGQDPRVVQAAKIISERKMLR